MPVGDYSVTASAGGFSSETMNPVAVSDGGISEANFALAESTATTYHVHGWDFTVDKKGPWYNLVATATLHDAGNPPPAGATVTGTIYRVLGTNPPTTSGFSDTTDAGGKIKLKIL